MDDRTLPHNLDAERSVLGAILVDEQAWAVAASRLSSDDFYRAAHQRIFAALRSLSEAGRPADFVLLCEQLRTAGELDECGGPAYVSSLADGLPKATNVEHYAAVVKEKARLRALILAANRLVTAAYAEEPPAQVAEAAVREIVETVEPDQGLLDGDAAVQRYVDVALSDEPQTAAVRTGYRDLDDLTGGFKRGDLVVVAARPGVGKTAFTLGAADNIAAAGITVPFFSLEMGPHGLGGRLLALRSRVSVSRIEARMLRERDYHLIAAAREATGRPLLLEFGARTVLQVEAWCRRLQQTRGIGCAVVDYLQLLAPERARGSDEADIASISRALKRLAKDLGIVVIAVSQLSRAPEGRRDKRPQLSDLRGSGAIEQDTDTAILLYRAEVYDRDPNSPDAGIAEVIVAKQRNGPQGVVRMCFLADYAQFCDLAIV